MKQNVILILFLIFTGWGMQAQSVKNEGPLTREQVERFIKTEFLVGKLQKRMMGEKGAMHAPKRDEIAIFYDQRKALVEGQGWKIKEFEAVKERVLAAKSSIEEYDEYLEEKQKSKGLGEDMRQEHQKMKDQKVYQEMINQIKANHYLSEKRKKTLINQIKSQRKNMPGMIKKIERADSDYLDARYQQITHNKADWPVVQPYLLTLSHLVDWYNGNRNDPPVLKDL